MMPRHPSQPSEALLEGAVLFAILFAMSFKKPPFPRGTYIGTFLVGYGIFRFLVEFIRQPDAQIGYLLGDWFTMGQLLSIPLYWWRGDCAYICLCNEAAARRAVFINE